MLFTLVAGGVSWAQVVDDVYYNPEKDRVLIQKQRPAKESNAYYEEGRYDDDNYSAGYEDEYDYYNDYDYYYTSRIRRFHRPYYGFGFFDPVYVDAWHYDPFLTPGVTMLIYDDYFSYRDWVRWNRWNRFDNWNRWNYFGSGFGWNNWGPGINVNIGLGWNSFGWNSWNSWNRWNSWGWDPWYASNRFNRFGWNSWGFGGPYYFGNSFVCPPSWGNGYTYNTIVNINDNDNSYFGPRTGGGATGPGPGSRPGRSPGFTDHSPETAPRRINTYGDRQQESDRARVPATTGAPRDLTPPAERATPQNRDADRFFDRYPTRDTESGRTISPERASPNNNTNAPGRATPVNPNTAGERKPSTPPTRTYDPNSSGAYDRPRSINPGNSSSSGANSTERRSPSSTYDRPRTTTPTPPTRTYDPNRNSTYERPRSAPPSNSGNNSSFDRPRSSSSDFSPSRSSGSSSASPSRSPSSSGSSSSAPRSSGSSSSSSSSGGRVKNN